MKKYFLLLLSLFCFFEGFSQIVGGAGIVHTSTNPNVIPSLNGIDRRYNGEFAFDTVAQKLWRYNSTLAVGARWQSNDSLVQAGVVASGDNLGNHTATQNLALGNFRATGMSNGINLTDAVNRTQLDSAANRKWGTTGNAGTTEATNFVGTTDNIGLVFRTNNIERGRFNTANQLLLQQGTDALPSLSFTGATGIGMRTDGTNLRWSVNGANRMILSPTGRITTDQTQSSTFINGGLEGANVSAFTAINALTPALTGFNYYNTYINSSLPLMTGGYSNVLINTSFPNLTSGMTGSIWLGGRDNLAATTVNSSVVMGNATLTNAKTVQYSSILGTLCATNAKYINTSSLEGYDNNRYMLRSNGSYLYAFNQNSSYMSGGEAHTVSSVSGNIITLSTPLPTEFIGGTMLFRVNNSTLTPLVANTNYSGKVLTTTTIEMNVTPLVGTTSPALTYSGAIAGVTITRSLDDADNVIGMGGNWHSKNGIYFGNANHTVFALKDNVYRFSLSIPALTTLNNNEGFFYNSSTNLFELKGLSSLAWSPTGNAGTSPTTNFVGTTDAQDLAFRTNSTERLRILSTGEVRAAAWGFTGNTTKITGSSGDIGLFINNIQRATLDASNTFSVGTGLDNEYTSTFILKSWNGVSGGSENFTIINSGTIGARYRVNTGRVHSFEVNATPIATIDNVGVGIGTTTPSAALHIVGTIPKAIIESPTASSTLQLKSNAGKTYDIASGANSLFAINNATDGKTIVAYDPTATTGYTQMANDNSYIKVQNDKKIVFSTTNSNVPISISNIFDPLPSFYFYDNNPILRLLQSDPTVTIGKGLGSIYAGGQISGAEKISGSFNFYASENWTNSAQGTSFELSTTANGINTPSPRIMVDGNGAIRLASNSETTSIVNIGGSVSFVIQKSNVTATLANFKTMIMVAGFMTLTSPSASTCKGREYRIINPTSTVGTITSYIALSGSATTNIPVNSTLNIVSDGTNWYQF
jgi:hypothetical protein